MNSNNTMDDKCYVREVGGAMLTLFDGTLSNRFVGHLSIVVYKVSEFVLQFFDFNI